MSKGSSKITVQGDTIRIREVKEEKYISLTDMARKFGEPNILISSWIKRKDTLEYLGVWEKLHNEKFKPHEFVGFRNAAGTNRFNLSPQKWIEKTNATGIISKSGRYGGTFANEDIAIHFGQWLSPEFSLYVAKEFKRFKKLELEKSSQGWQLNRMLSKINYRIHTDAIKKRIIPTLVTQKQISLVYASEADILNIALFGLTAKQWKNQNPDKKGSIRDYADVRQLVCLANLESLNAELIRQKLSQSERLRRLNKIAIVQMESLVKNTLVKRLK
ncbi:MAG: KilA-N domain-containing protein [Patescibacteria group bacterium]|nr:KilA-N domain-containing protein [Patescibacteria group bacterium]